METSLEGHLRRSLIANISGLTAAFIQTWPRVALLAIVAIILCSAPSFAQIVGTAQLNVERRGHTATLLDDGRVLIVGGDNTGGMVGQTEIVDPIAQTASLVGSTNNARTDHTATRLLDGRLLIVGGRGPNGALTSSEIYDPITGSFTAGPALTAPRSGHTATVLANGNILIAGGDLSGSAEIYNQVTQSFSPVAANMTALRKFHSAILTSAGQVLIVGGVDPQNTVLNTAEIYDPASQSFYIPPTDLKTARALATLKLLSDGKVQIIGGDADLSMEVFDPLTGIFNAKALLPPNINLLGATLGTQSRAALFSPLILQDPMLQGVLTPEQSTLLDRADQSITELPSRNQALVVGGINSAGQILNSAILIQSSSASVTTDKTDYPPGEMVTITGSGFQPNEQVQLSLHEFPEEYPDITFSALANQQGNFVATDFAPQLIDLNRTFSLTAIGQLSGFTAQTAFTDGNITAATTPTTHAPSGGACATAAKNTFTLGETVCAKTTITVQTPPAGPANFRIQWIGPAPLTAVVQETPKSGTNGSVQTDQFVPTAAGTWTVRVCNPSGNCATGALLASTTFTVSAGLSVTFNAIPISDMPNGTTVLSVTIGAGPSTAVTKAELPKTFGNIASGTNVSYSYVSPLTVSSSKQYRWSSTSGAASASAQTGQTGAFNITSNSTVSASYLAQFQQTFAQSGLAADAIGTVVTVDGVTKVFGDLPFSKFIDAGTTVTYAYSDPVTSNVAGKQYRKDSINGPVSGYTVSAANTITGTYAAQYQQTFTHSGLDVDASSSVVTVDGVTKNRSDLPFSKFVDAGVSVTYAYSDPVTSSVAGKRYRRNSITGPTSGYMVSGANMITGNYVAQHQLTLAITPGVPGGLSNIGGGTTGTFYDSGMELSLSATTPVADGSLKQWRFANWTGDVTASPNSTNPVSVVMDQPRSITTNYIVQWLQTFTASGLTSDASGTVVVIGAASQNFADLPFSKFVDQGATVGYAYTSPVSSTISGKRYRLGSVSGPGTGYVVSGPNTVTGNYIAQWQLTFTASGLPLGGASVTGSNTVVSVASSSKNAANLPFSDWFDSGASVPYAFSSAISTVPVSDKQYELTNTVALPSSPITVSSAMTITGVYSLNVYTIHYLRPIDESTAASYLVNTGKNGRVIPVKVEIFKNGVPVLAGDVLMRIAGSNCAAGSGDAPVEEYADAGNSNNGTNLFRLTSDSWIYNLDTKALGLVNNNCYRLDVYFGTITGPTAVKLSSSVWAIFKPVR